MPPPEGARPDQPASASPHRNRVAPTGEIIAIPSRGAWMGNRGILHDDDGHIVRHHANQLWIICRLSFRGWRAHQWEPHHYTPLFFHDEAVALAAGHRPCALCQREAYNGFRAAVAAAEGSDNLLPAKDIDRRLHEERLVARTSTQRLHSAQWSDLPDGAFVMVGETPNLLWRSQIHAWTPKGYGPAATAPRRGAARLITPPTTVSALQNGFVPQVDPGVDA